MTARHCRSTRGRPRCRILLHCPLTQVPPPPQARAVHPVPARGCASVRARTRALRLAGDAEARASSVHARGAAAGLAGSKEALGAACLQGVALVGALLAPGLAHAGARARDAGLVAAVERGAARLRWGHRTGPRCPSTARRRACMGRRRRRRPLRPPRSLACFSRSISRAVEGRVERTAVATVSPAGRVAPRFTAAAAAAGSAAAAAAAGRGALGARVGRELVALDPENRVAPRSEQERGRGDDRRRVGWAWAPPVDSSGREA